MNEYSEEALAWLRQQIVALVKNSRSPPQIRTAILAYLPDSTELFRAAHALDKELKPYDAAESYELNLTALLERLETDLTYHFADDEVTLLALFAHPSQGSGPSGSNEQAPVPEESRTAARLTFDLLLQAQNPLGGVELAQAFGIPRDQVRTICSVFKQAGIVDARPYAKPGFSQRDFDQLLARLNQEPWLRVTVQHRAAPNVEIREEAMENGSSPR